MGPTLYTDRLLLREWTVDDAEAAYQMYGDPEVTRFLGDGKVVPDVAAQWAWLSERIEHYRSPAMKGFGVWAVVERDSQEVIGTVLLKPLVSATNDEIEIGWHLNRRVWGKGYASEAARRVLEYGFGELHLERIFAVVKPGNDRSVAVARRIGMQWLERTTQYYNGEELDLFCRRGL